MVISYVLKILQKCKWPVGTETNLRAEHGTWMSTWPSTITRRLV